MIARSVLQCGVLAVSLVFIAAPAGACDGPRCARASKVVASSQPLQLSQFMRRPSGVAARAAKAWRATATKVAIASPRKQSPAAAEPAGPAEPPSGASQALASQPAVLVREVASDELNEIDLAANAAPTERGALAMAAGRAVQLAEAREVNGTDRKASDVRPILASVAAGSRGTATGTPAMNENWAVRVWNMLSAGTAAVASAARWLVS